MDIGESWRGDHGAGTHVTRGCRVSPAPGSSSLVLSSIQRAWGLGLKPHEVQFMRALGRASQATHSQFLPAFRKVLAGELDEWKWGNNHPGGTCHLPIQTGG